MNLEKKRTAYRFEAAATVVFTIEASTLSEAHRLAEQRLADGKFLGTLTSDGGTVVLAADGAQAFLRAINGQPV